MKRTYYNPYHVAFLIILTIHYFLSFIFFDGIIFGQETDVFEAELLFNKILGDIYKKDFYILDSLLSGNYEWYYFTRALYIINYIYSFFSTENAYIIIDIACKTVAYISFFKLSKLVNNKNFYSFLISAIYAYASTSSFTDYHSSIFGFGSAILPYLTYLSLKKKDLKIKNFLIIILSAINSHFYFGIFYLLIPFILYLYDNNLNKIKSLKIFIIFFIFCIIANSNLLYLALFNEVTFNRDNWQTESLSIYQNIAYFFNSLFYFPLHFTSIELPNGEIKNILYFTTFFNKICLFLIYSLALFLLVTNKIKNSLLFLIIILGILLISFISKTHLYSSLIDYFDIGIVKTIQMTRIKVILTFLILFAISNIRINEIKNYIFMTLIFTFFIFQINHILLPAFKKYINYNSYTELEKKELKYNIINFNFSQLIVSIKENFKEEENHNYLTINNYYDTQNFTYIKNLVKDEYVLPININPAKLIYNRIKTAGGYFQFYPQSYKDKFEKIIDNELNKNITWKKDFDTWGHRLYAFVEDSRNIELNFMQIKKMKITYLLSNVKLLDENLQTVCENCNDNKKINLYSIK